MTSQSPTLFVIFLSCPSAGLAGYLARYEANRWGGNEPAILVEKPTDAEKFLSMSNATGHAHWWAARMVPKGAEFRVEVRRYEP